MDLLLIAGILVTKSVKDQYKEFGRGTDQSHRLKSSEGVEIRVRQERAAGMTWRRELSMQDVAAIEKSKL